MLSNFITVALSAIILLASGCSKSGGYGNSSNYPPTTTSTKAITIKSNSTFGNYMVDKDGRTLYFFANDADGKNHCGAGCDFLWPIFNVANLSADNLGAGLNASDFSHITTATGASQLTYKGWPLYYYAPGANGSNSPEAPGSTQGDGVLGLWFIGKPDYSIMMISTQLVGLDGKNYKFNDVEGTETTTYLSDGSGATLYAFSQDNANKNTFTKSDFSNNNIWPIYETDQVIIPSILNKSDFGSINVFGKKQLTYKNWPLYHFGQDAGARGSNKGVSFPTPGMWHVPLKNFDAAQ
ncbi:MAG: hypothetical protein JST75_11400 [Bacteroidetes bacterium]|nr:hypothetical protein [Bacteroidota bacterium]